MKKTNKLIISALCVAIYFIFSKIKLLEFLFPLGGSITLFFMLILTLPAYLYGFKYGLLTTLCFSILKYLTASNIYYLLQGVIDYFLSYICFSVAGLNTIRLKKYGIILGFILGCLLRIIFAILSGYLFFKEYTSNRFNPIIYSIVYNGSCILTEMFLSIIIIKVLIINNTILKKLIKN